MSTIKKFKRGWLGKKTDFTISSPYGYRIHPVYHTRKFHRGNDINVPVGTAIYAPCAGNVTRKFEKTGAGLYVTLSADGYVFYFMHLSRVGKTGTVKEGDIIGYTGGKKGDPNAGTSTGPHLHFEVRKDGKSIDSRHWITDRWQSITGRTIVSEMSSVPLITKPKSEYTDAEKLERLGHLNDMTNNVDDEYDASEETDWENSEMELILDKELNEGLAAGIWQIMKLVVDGNVANLRVRDAATSLQQGALINFFQKMCQEPFVEFFGDTYGDQYYFIVRKPPFDKEGMLKTMTTQGLFSSTQSEENPDEILIKPQNSTIYDIDENDIITSNLSFNNQGIYSWYQFIPIYELGSPAELQYLIPAVLFPEYASIWGSRSLIIRSQYRNFINSVITDEVKNGEKSEQGDTEVRNSIHDLKYLIESNAYAPFVRQGNIQIIGNRKFKRGTFVRIKWSYLNCSEIFFIDNVSQNYSINNNGTQRITTLTLSKGMLEDYMFNQTDSKITKITENGNNADVQISYFNIIDFGDYEKNKDKIDMNKWRDVISSWKVNTDVFNFFLRKMQFISQNAPQSVEVINNRKNIF